MAYTQRQVALQAPATNTTQDYTSAGFGTAQGVLLFAATAGSGSDVNGIWHCIGMWDTSTALCVSNIREHNVVAASRRNICKAETGNVLEFLDNAGNVDRSATISAVTDGIRLTWAGSDTSIRPYVVAVLINGTNGIDVQALTCPDAASGTASITGLSNTPKMGFFASTRSNVIDNAFPDSEISFGFAYDDGGVSPFPQHAVAYACQDNSTQTRLHAKNDEISITFDGQTAVEYSMQLTAWNSDGITITNQGPNGGAAGTDVCCFLVDMAEDCEVFESTVPTTDVAWTPLTGASFTPTATIMISTFALNVGSDEEDNNAGFFGLYAANDNSEEHCIGICDEDAAATSNCSGRLETQFYNQDDTAGTPDFTASSPSFTSGQIQYSSANAGEGSIAAKVFGIAIGAAGAAPETKSGSDLGTFNKDTAEEAIDERAYSVIDQAVVDADESLILSRDDWINDSGIIGATETGSVFSNVLLPSGTDIDDVTQLEASSLTQLGTTAKSGTDSGIVGSTETNAQLDKLDVSVQKVGNDSGDFVDEIFTNVILWSEELSNIPWEHLYADLPIYGQIDSNATLDPNGNLTADRLRGDGSSNIAPTISQTIPVAASTKHYVSGYAKADSNNYIQVAIEEGAGSPPQIEVAVTFNLATGTVHSGAPGGGPGESSSEVSSWQIVDVGNGWYRWSFNVTTNTETSKALVINSIYDPVTSEGGPGTQSIFVWGVNVTQGDSLGDYIKTEGVAKSLTSERAQQLLIDASKTGSDSAVVNSTETFGRQISGTVLKSAAESVSFFGLESETQRFEKSGSDTFSLLGATETNSIEIVVFEPTWEDDDVLWGGLQLGSKNRAPIFVDGTQFYILGRGTEIYLDSYIERKAAVYANGLTLLGRGIYPQITGAKGQVIQISLGGHDLPEGEVDWEGPYDFTIGEDVRIDFQVSGKYLATKFESSLVSRWQLQSFDVDYEVVGIE